MNAEPSRTELEEAVLATLWRRQDRFPAALPGFNPGVFQVPVHARIAKAFIDCYRLKHFLCSAYMREQLDEESRGTLERFRDVSVLPEDTDLLAVLAGKQSVSALDLGHACAPLTEFAAEPRAWLWPGHVELGQLTLVGGEPGSGKSLIACDLAARTAAGHAWPDGAAASEPGSVLLVAAGHEVSGLLRPRLEAAGADLGRIHVLPIDQRPTSSKRGEHSMPFKKTLSAIEDALAAMKNCRLVVIDPLRLTIGRTQTTVGGDPAAPLELLAAAARRNRVAMLGVACASYEDRRRTLAGSLKLAAGAAAVWQVLRHPYLKHLRLFLPVKTTCSSDLEGLAFTVIEERSGARVEWHEGNVPADLVAGHPHVDAARWLRQALAGGPLASKEVLQLGGQNGYTPRMLHHAKAAAGVAVTRDGFGPGANWRWTLATPPRAETAKTA